MPEAKKLILYIDDTGSRDPDRLTHHEQRDDRMDCFGLGGILIKEEDIGKVLGMHADFCGKWNIDYPLHSSSIRVGRGKFGWLKKPETAGFFFPELQEFLLSLPFIGLACIIDRPGYVLRYKDHYNEKLWLMCKTAYCILLERAAKFADDQNHRLEVFIEQSGKKEDRDIIQYTRDLKRHGSPFDLANSGGYKPLTKEDYQRIILGEPRRKTKKVPMIQLADLILYPIAKGGYDPNYRPYKQLIEHKKLIDCYLPIEQVPYRGIKYSCFERIKKGRLSKPS
ncbi:MAG: DUF3800 domain-containing protein [Bacteroidota bacterium]